MTATFHSKYAGYALHIGEENEEVAPNRFQKVLVKAQFVGGMFTTSDEKIITYMRRMIKEFKTKEFFEVTSEDEKEFAKAKEKAAAGGSAAASPFKK